MRDPSVADAGDEHGRLTRLLVIALGLLGFVVLPATVGTPSAAGGVGVRAGTAQTGQNVTPRGKSSKPCPVRAESAIAAVARQLPGVSAPVSIPVVLPPGVDVRPRSALAERPLAGATAFRAAPSGIPRGRAPPSSTGI